MQKMPPFTKDANASKPRNEETQPNIDSTEAEVSLFGTDGYEKSVSKYYCDILLRFSFSKIIINKF